MLLPLNLNVATNIIRVINVIMNTYLIQLKWAENEFDEKAIMCVFVNMRCVFVTI